MPMAGSNSTPQNVTHNNSATNNSSGAGGGGGNNNNTPSAATATVGSNKTWELSDYELHRIPQEAIIDGSEIAVSPRALHSELMCPICLDMLHNTMTTKECLHRFCADCIITALRSGNKECPTCRKKLVSKRSLRHDPNFDQLISKIYPSRDEYEAQQQKAMARLSKSHNQLALASSIEEGLKAQSQQRKPTKPPGKGSGQPQTSDQQQDNGDAITINETLSTATNGQQPQQTTANSLMNMSSNSLTQHQVTSNNNGAAAAAVAAAGIGVVIGTSGPSPAKISRTDSVGGENSSNTSGYSEEVTEVELVFKPHPDMLINNTGANAVEVAQSQTRFIKTTANASVEHLAKYLGMRLALDSQIGGSGGGGGSTNNTSTLHNCTIYVSPFNTENNFIVVPQNHTLAQVCEKYWRFNKPLEMYYSWKRI